MALLKGSMFVTGSNGGLGSSIVERIVSQSDLSENYFGIYTIRKPGSDDNVQRILQSAGSKHSHELVTMDLSSLSSVRQVAQKINDRVSKGSLPRIRALILNAGYLEHNPQTFTKDGFDMTFQSGYLGHFLLTLLLLQSMDKENGRIIVLGSWTHDTTDPHNNMGPTGALYKSDKYRQIFMDPINTESLAKGLWSNETDGGMRRYGASKLCSIMMFLELVRRLSKDPALQNISVLGVDPGVMPSNLTRRENNWVLFMLRKKLKSVISPMVLWWNPDSIFRTTWKSAGDVLRAAFDREELGDHPSGVYVNGRLVADVGPEAKDVKKSGMLWENSLRYAQVFEGDTALVDWQ